MKKVIFISIFLMSFFTSVAQIQVIDSVDHIVYKYSGVHRAMPKRDISTEYNDPFLTVRYKYETLFRISSNASVTSPTSTSMVDLRNKIIAIIAASAGGGGVTPSGEATLTNKTIPWGSNTFTGTPPYSTASTTETLTNKTISWSGNTFTGTAPFLLLTGGTVSGNILPEVSNSRSLGTPSLNYASVNAREFISNAAAQFGTIVTNQNILFRQGSTSQYVGGFFLTTGAAFFQAPGVVPASTGEQVQIIGTAKITGQLNTSADLLFNDNGEGPVIKSTPGGLKWRIIVSDAGVLSTVSVP